MHPWTVSIPLTRDDTFVMYKYACHEVNQAVELTLLAPRTPPARRGGHSCMRHLGANRVTERESMVEF